MLQPQSPLPQLELIDNNTLLIDNSTLERFTTCPRSSEYYVLQKREANKSSSATNFGSSIHKGLESFYTHRDIALAHEAVITHFQAFPQPIDDEWRTVDLALETITSYAKNYPNELFDVCCFPDGKRMTELSFAVPVGSIGLDPREVESFHEYRHQQHDTTGKLYTGFGSSINIVWTGRIDMLVDENNKIYVFDHKTSSIYGSQFFDEYAISQQMYGYVFAAENMLGREVHGYVVNAIINRRPTKTGKGREFGRQRFLVDRDHLGEWQRDVLNIVSDFFTSYLRQYMPKYTKYCNNKYGKCPYFDVCSLPVNQRHIMLDSDLYRDVTWSPLKDN